MKHSLLPAIAKEMGRKGVGCDRLAVNCALIMERIGRWMLRVECWVRRKSRARRRGVFQGTVCSRPRPAQEAYVRSERTVRVPCGPADAAGCAGAPFAFSPRVICRRRYPRLHRPSSTRRLARNPHGYAHLCRLHRAGDRERRRGSPCTLAVVPVTARLGLSSVFQQGQGNTVRGWRATRSPMVGPPQYSPLAPPAVRC